MADQKADLPEQDTIGSPPAPAARSTATLFPSNFGKISRTTYKCQLSPSAFEPLDVGEGWQDEPDTEM